MHKKDIFRAKLIGCVRIGIFAVLVVLFALLCVLELIPQKQSGLTVKEVFQVSSGSLSPFDAPTKEYTCHLRGRIDNPTDRDVRVEMLRVTVEGEGKEKTVELAGFLLPARSSREINESFADAVNYDTVKAVSVTVEGKAETLANRTSGFAISGVLIFGAVGLVIAALLLWDSCKRFRYLRQELAVRFQKM